MMGLWASRETETGKHPEYLQISRGCAISYGLLSEQRIRGIAVHIEWCRVVCLYVDLELHVRCKQCRMMSIFSWGNEV